MNKMLWAGLTAVSLLLGAAGQMQAFVEGPEEIVLTNSHNREGVSIGETMANPDKLLVFDFWYDADPFPLTIGASYVEQDLWVFRQPGFNVATLWSYEQSKSWSTVMLPLGLGSDAYFYKPNRTLGDFPGMDTDPAFRDYVMNNKITIRNIMSFKSLEDYQAFLKNSTVDGPVPEPATMAMFGAGFFSLLGFEIRRRRLSA